MDMELTSRYNYYCHQRLSKFNGCILYNSGVQQICSHLTCASPTNFKGSLNIVRGISQDFDVEVMEWRDELIERIPKPTTDVSVYFSVYIYME